MANRTVGVLSVVMTCVMVIAGLQMTYAAEQVNPKITIAVIPRCLSGNLPEEKSFSEQTASALSEKLRQLGFPHVLARKDVESALSHIKSQYCVDETQKIAKVIHALPKHDVTIFVGPYGDPGNRQSDGSVWFDFFVVNPVTMEGRRRSGLLSGTKADIQNRSATISERLLSKDAQRDILLLISTESALKPSTEQEGK